jgi:Ca2+-binding RTX toxin-like protein
VYNDSQVHEQALALVRRGATYDLSVDSAIKYNLTKLDIVLDLGSTNTVYGGDDIFVTDTVKYTGSSAISLSIQADVARVGQDYLYEIESYVLSSGNDTIHVNRKNPGSVRAGDGDDRFTFGLATYNGKFYGENGNDIFDVSGADNYTAIQVYGGEGDDRLYGKTQATTYLSGDGGDDYIIARSRNDANGGSGSDTIIVEGLLCDVWGGSGVDIFTFKGVGGIKTLCDYQAGETIYIEDYLLMKKSDGSFASPVYSGADTIFRIDNIGNEITIENAHLTFSDIVIV